MINPLNITLARLAIALAAITLIANLSVSTAVMRGAHYSAARKISWLCLIWLLPLVGAWLAGVYLTTKQITAPMACPVAPPSCDTAAVQGRFASQRVRCQSGGMPAFTGCMAGTC